MGAQRRSFAIFLLFMPTSLFSIWNPHIFVVAVVETERAVDRHKGKAKISLYCHSSALSPLDYEVFSIR